MSKYETSGVLGGAASGAAIGTGLMPGWGTAAGAVIGGLIGLFGSKKKKIKKYPTMNPMQQKLFDEYSQGLMGKGRFADMFNFNGDAARTNWEKMYAQPAYQNFKEGVVPGITGSFRGGNLQNSSYLGGALSKAGTDVQRGLDAHLSNILYQGSQDALNRRTGAINTVLNTQTFAYGQPQQTGGQQALGALYSAGGDAIANMTKQQPGDGKTTAAPSVPTTPETIPGLSKIYNPTNEVI